jgi:intracellular septation protein A
MKKNIEIISALKNEMTHIWGAATVVLGGAVTILLNELNTVKITLGVFGLLFFFALLNAYMIRRNEVTKIIDNMED